MKSRVLTLLVALCVMFGSAEIAYAQGTITLDKPPINGNHGNNGNGGNNHHGGGGNVGQKPPVNKPEDNVIDANIWNQPVPRPDPIEVIEQDPRAVDLGLRTLWATHNIGADSPEECGDFFAWGELNPKQVFNTTNCKTWNVNLNDISGNSNYDVAAREWGDGWHLPTLDDIQDLIENTTYRWVYKNGVYGAELTSKINGNKIFLPAGGFKTNHVRNYTNTTGAYWTSTSTSPQHAYCIIFKQDMGRVGYNAYSRFAGFNVRPVKKRRK